MLRECLLKFIMPFLFSFEGNKLKSAEERDSLIVDCLVKLGRLDEAAKRLHKMILTHPDHWLYIKTYIRCQVQRCQNFRERVRQQVERDRKSRQQQETTENGTGSSGDSTNGDTEGSRNSETEKDRESREKGSRDSGGVGTAGGGEKCEDGVSSLDGQGQGEEETGERGGDNERGTGKETGDVGEDEETEAGAKEITVR